MRSLPESEHWTSLEARLRDILGGQAYDKAWTQASELTIDEAIAWMRRARGKRKRPPSGWESLTPTEAKVVELVALGLTNPQIGERMFISRATVKAHLAHIFHKLGVRTRSELTARAVRRASISR